MHNLFKCDDPVTIWVVSQSSSVTSFVDECLDSLGE